MTKRIWDPPRVWSVSRTVLQDLGRIGKKKKACIATTPTRVRKTPWAEGESDSSFRERIEKKIHYRTIPLRRALEQAFDLLRVIGRYGTRFRFACSAKTTSEKTALPKLELGGVESGGSFRKTYLLKAFQLHKRL